ncbi:MAG: sigma 54-interacting transcriptional regulator [Deltaproteobacteria bacterium]|nr:sigma 54-interacting transcriptional regulator [Deltaproteobacteria bacterium]
MAKRILVVDDEESIRFTFESFLSEQGFLVDCVENYDEAVAKFQEIDFDLIFADIILGGKTGIDLMRVLRKTKPTTPVILITGVPSIDTAAEALRLGALDYIVKPVRQDALLRATDVALKHKALADEKESYRTNLEAIFRSVRDGIITVDEGMSVTEMNDAAEKICGVQRSDIIGKPMYSVAGACNGKCLGALARTLKSQEPAEIHYLQCLAKHKPRQVVSVTSSPLLSHEHRFSGGVMVVKDETRLADLERSLSERREFDKIIGKSKGIEKVRSLIKDLADLQTIVLITGESGTGKELVAEALHFGGERKNKPLVKLNCAALTENLLESELFGHVRGAFTGAVKDKVGRFQRADEGTIFLDEIGDISPRMQLRLLRVIETMEFERVGESNPVKVDVRVLAATNRVLKEKVAQGEFREDLFYRVKVVEIEVPPLRERRDDIPLLLKHFVKKFNRKFNKQITGIAPEVERILMTYHWPGNIRELENTLEHACIRCHEPLITFDCLPVDFSQQVWGGLQSNDDKSTHEADAIRRALQRTGWNKAQAALDLGMSRRTIYRKIEKYRITLPT